MTYTDIANWLLQDESHVVLLDIDKESGLNFFDELKKIVEPLKGNDVNHNTWLGSEGRACRVAAVSRQIRTSAAEYYLKQLDLTKKGLQAQVISEIRSLKEMLDGKHKTGEVHYDIF